MGVEVALGRTIEGRVLGELATVMILDVLQTLSEVFMMVWLASIRLKDNMGEQSSQLTLANFSRC